jgi:hypothetical protein
VTPARGSAQSPRRASRRHRHWKYRGVLLCYRALRAAQRYLPPGVRTIVGLLMMAAGLLGFLPLLGFWMFPLGVLVAITDVPPLRRRTERWLNDVRRRYHVDSLARLRDSS